jgi:hypothetical protein
MRIARIVVALVTSILLTAAVSGTAAADPPGMTHDSIVEMTHD